MKSLNGKTLDIIITFTTCVVGIIITFLCIALVFHILVWLLMGSFDLTKKKIFEIIRIGCIIGSFTGVVFITARLLKIKGF